MHLCASPLCFNLQNVSHNMVGNLNFSFQVKFYSYTHNKLYQNSSISYMCFISIDHLQEIYPPFKKDLPYNLYVSTYMYEWNKLKWNIVHNTENWEKSSSSLLTFWCHEINGRNLTWYSSKILPKSLNLYWREFETYHIGVKYNFILYEVCAMFHFNFMRSCV